MQVLYIRFKSGKDINYEDNQIINKIKPIYLHET